MKCYHALYVSESLESQKEEILQKIKTGRWQHKKFVLTLTDNETNHLEFFDANMLLQKTIIKEDLFVVGIGDGYSGALELVQKITDEVYAETRDVNIRKFLLTKQQEYEESNV